MFCSRQSENKGCSCVWLAFDFNRAAQSIDQLFYDSQAKARAANRACTGFVYPVETLEYARQIFSRNANALVFDCEFYFIGFLAGFYKDFSTIRRIFDCVIHQVDQDLF